MISLKKMTSCGCIGPKSWSELLIVTGLGRNTLSRTCKFLVSKKALRRTVMKKRGHHVVYSIDQAYRPRLMLWEEEIESSPKERKKTFANLRRTNYTVQRTIVHVKRMLRRYKNSAKLLDEMLPGWMEEMSIDSAMCLLRLSDAFGTDTALQLMKERHETMNSLRFDSFTKNVAYRGKIPTNH